ncbi:MAG TPA: hypothetical protein VJZ76_08280 [Thermoanaerobaculia bacterium]|nr:hypothetical protein [Thermoanaerobaculia bacterium]
MILILTLMAALAGGVSAQPATTTAAPAPVPPIEEAQTRQQVREQFTRLLSQHPSEVAPLVTIDPTLLSNDPFLARYPELAQYVAAHPEIRRNPHYFVQELPNPLYGRQRSAWQEAVEAIGVGFVITLIAFILTWLVRTLIEQRRWSRLSRTQAEVHNKILDRFGSTEELLAYVKTPAGSKFLESAPIPLHVESAGASAPMTRVLWSIQIGLIVAAGGLGMLLVSGRFDRETAQGFFAMGTIAACIGGGFILSAIVSAALSRRLGAKPLPDEAELVR